MLNKQKKQEGILIFVISGPGGVGKTTLVNNLFLKECIRERFLKGISCTTRKRRPDERCGGDYFFVTKEEFLYLKKKKFFLESEKILENYYGTPKSLYLMAKKLKKHLVLCIDVKGGIYLKKNIKDDRIITIFISAPREEDLHFRMGIRAENKILIEKRVELAKREVKLSDEYDYVVMNKKIDDTVKKLEKILMEEKSGG